MGAWKGGGVIVVLKTAFPRSIKHVLRRRYVFEPWLTSLHWEDCDQLLFYFALFFK